MSLNYIQTRFGKFLYLLTIDGDNVDILVYVDEILMLASKMKLLNKVAKMIRDKFEIIVEAAVSKFLGMIIDQDSIMKTVKMHSTTLIDQMLERFRMKERKPVKNALSEVIVYPIQ